MSFAHAYILMAGGRDARATITFLPPVMCLPMLHALRFFPHYTVSYFYQEAGQAGKRKRKRKRRQEKGKRKEKATATTAKQNKPSSAEKAFSSKQHAFSSTPLLNNLYPSSSSHSETCLTETQAHQKLTQASAGPHCLTGQKEGRKDPQEEDSGQAVASSWKEEKAVSPEERRTMLNRWSGMGDRTPMPQLLCSYASQVLQLFTLPILWDKPMRPY